ncbi:MAG: aspartyl protease family protein [Gammaproteobacteria bacterium]
MAEQVVLSMSLLSRQLGIVVIALVMGGCASSLRPDEAVASAPFAIDVRGRLVVNLSLNGRAPQPFIVDSAASISALYENHPGLSSLPLPGTEITVHGLSASGPRPVVQVDSVRLGAARWRDVLLVTLPAPPPDAKIARPPVGILGHDLLSRYGVAFEILPRTIRLYSHAAMAQRHYAGWQRVALSRGAPGTPAGSIYFFTVSIEGEEAKAVFDLGSGVNIVNWPAARRVGLSREHYAARRAASIDGVLAKTDALPRFIAGHIATDSVSWREEIFSIADVEIFTTLGLGERPAALLGAGLFAQRDFVLDFENDRVLIRRSAEVESLTTPAQ